MTPFAQFLAGAQPLGGGGTAYRYYRVISTVTPGAYAFLIGDIELFAATTPPTFPSNATDLTLGLPQNLTYFFQSSGADSSVKPWHAFDDSTVSEWYSGAAGGDPGPFVGVDFQTATLARSANVRTAGAFSGGDSLSVQGSNDFAIWTTLATTVYTTAVANYPLSW